MPIYYNLKDLVQLSSWPSISVSSFIKLSSILLEICSGQKCDRRTYGRMDGLMDKAETIGSPIRGE